MLDNNSVNLEVYEQTRTLDNDRLAHAINIAKGNDRTTDQFAKEIGLSPSKCSRIRNGNITRPLKKDVLEKIAEHAVPSVPKDTILLQLLKANGMTEKPKDDTTEDLCPAGWRMPTGNAAGEYSVLLSDYYTDTTASNIGSYQYALSTPLSGYFNNGSAINQDTLGVFWPSTRNNNYRMYRLFANSSDALPTDYNNRYSGHSMRCLLDS